MRRAMVTVLALAPLVAALPADAQPAANPMHPAFPLLDEAGQPTMPGGAPPSPQRTCGACHDTAWIQAHDVHNREGRTASCVDCHLEGSRLPSDPADFEADGRIRREALRISAPRDANCAHCHGVVHSGPAPLRIPDDFRSPQQGRTYALTRDTGEVLSPQDVSASWLNIEGRDGLDLPWDVHARRLVGCTSCHFARNNPARSGVRHTALDFVVNDPRKVPVSQFLHRPDHDLVAASCRSCHDPMKVHDFLPYRQRHMDTLDCRACHSARLFGPAAQAIDATVVMPDGGPRVEYRNVSPGPGETLDTAFLRPYTPFLMARTDPLEGTRLAPFNVVTRWYWASGTTGQEVPADRLLAAWRDGDADVAAVVRALDGNGDGILDPGERRLDTPARVQAIRDRLLALGVHDPGIRAEIRPRPVEHGVMAGANVPRDCAGCHGEDSRIQATIPLASFVPGGVVPPLPEGGVEVSGHVVATAEGGLELSRTQPPGFHVFGHSRVAWVDRLGFLAFAAVAAGVLVHGGLRWRARRRNGHAQIGRAHV